ncbi:MAG: DUF5667 domain-containing protein [archaeon]
MKFTNILIILVLLCSFPVLAEGRSDADSTYVIMEDETDELVILTDESSEETDAGLTPDNPFYFLDVIWDDIVIAFSFNEENRIRKELEITNERMEEVKLMAENGDYTSMKKASENHARIMIKIQNEVQSMENEQVQEQYQQQYDMMKIQINEVTNTIKIKVKGDISEEDQALIDSIVTEFESIEEYEVELKEIDKGQSQDKESEYDDNESGDDSEEDESEEDNDNNEKAKGQNKED